LIQNLSIQVVPINSLEAYSQIDVAINIIKKSGLVHSVTAFNTQIEGELSELLDLIKKIQETLFELGTEEVLLNFQIHAKRDKDVFLKEKVKI